MQRHGAAELAGYYLQGSEYPGYLYESNGSETVTVQGDAYTLYPLYMLIGSTYVKLEGTLYKEGSTRTFYKRHTTPIGELYNAGTYVGSGLYKNFKAAEIVTQDVTVLST